MSDADPYDDEFEIVGGRKRQATAFDGFADPTEGDSLDRACAFYSFNDFGNAQRLIARFGADLMHVPNTGWLAWDGQRWNRDSGERDAFRLSHQVSRAMRQEISALKEKPGDRPEATRDRVERLYAWANQSGNISRSHGMLAAAAPYLAQPIDALDRQEFLLTAQNGTIELGLHCELRDSRREDRITRALGVSYNTKAQCPQFDRFLARIMPSEDMRGFLQRILGYCLTGSIQEHKLFLFYGTGRNGKSTLINVIRKVMGDYAMGSPVSTFLAKREGNSGGEPSPDLARLPGARMVAAAEPPEGGRLDESRVKEMTGGDPMVVRHLNQGFFEFRPVFKTIISTNHLPTIRGADHGIWSRINLVPFTVQIPEDEIDRNLEAKLFGEGEGVLQWMLTGAEDWRAQGLSPPEKAIAAVERYRADEDPVGEFLKARCKVCPKTVNPGTGRLYEVGAKRIREAYVEWCKDEGLDPLTPRTFGGKISARGIAWRKSDGNRYWTGLRLIEEAI